MTTMHPHGLLTASEIDDVVDLVRSLGLADEATFRRVAVAEGYDDERHLEVWLYRADSGEIDELVLSMASRNVVAKTTVEGSFPQPGFAELQAAIQLVRSDAGVAEAVAKRGISDPEKLQVDPWPAGDMGLDIEKGHRSVRCILFYRDEAADNGYARPVDGLLVFVDLDEMRVFHIDDSGTWPLPAEKSNYDADAMPQREGLEPIEITQPDGPSFAVSEGNHISWQNWDVRVLFDQTEGLVLQSLGWTDGDRRRPIVRRASLAEMVVPYGEVRETQAFKNALDVGEIGLGRTVNSLRLGCDCLGDITYLDAAWCMEDGSPVHVDQAICIHEEDFGIGWKHTDSPTESAEVRRSRRLVISSIFTVGNYDYGIFWYLYLDGTIQMEMKLTGIVTTMGYAPGDDLTYATLVAPEVAAPIHQHVFCARFDLEVDGPNNTVYRLDIETDEPGPHNPHNNAFRSVATRLATEAEAVDNVDQSKARTWKIVNEGARNRLDQPTGYKLLPADTATLFAGSESRIAGRAGFARHNIWVTPTDRSQRFPAGNHVWQSPPEGQGLPTWTAADRPIADTDITLWHSFGLTHNVRVEDYPVMPTEYARCTLVPFGFFDRNPALDVPPNDHCHMSP